ncbi:hypothetical protein NBZ79_01110 [Sneathiella marina]|uniref:Gluconate 2-dehydrogenase subunit 3 family protein n=1 Tax=Sneathiella marina TaxID=2950108 RepID=A0ABY4W427_9PROT|nr:hypothetical protein [Sneathiella marina]USG61574.1 hypothetical protein NBZ79_01110 [Sneathiella marina]
MNISDNNTGTNALSAHEREIFVFLVGCIIPSAKDLDLPGADDPVIIEDIIAIGQQNTSNLKKLICELDTLAPGDFQDLTSREKAALIHEFRHQCTHSALFLETITATGYYRDPRVLEHIGVEVRPPFPEGYHVEQGDWGLLDPVRERGPIFIMPD